MDSGPFQPMLTHDAHRFEHCGTMRWTMPLREIPWCEPGFSVTTRGTRVTKPNLRIVTTSAGVPNNHYIMQLRNLYNEVSSTLKTRGTLPARQAVTLALRKIGTGTYARLYTRDLGAMVAADVVPELAVPEEDICIADRIRNFDDLQRVYIHYHAPLRPLSETPFHVVQPRESWDSANSCFLFSRAEGLTAYVKIYPQGVASPMSLANFDFFVVTFHRLPFQQSLAVCLIPQEVWTSRESFRRDENWLVSQTVRHPAATKILLDNHSSHRVGEFNVRPIFDPRTDTQTGNSRDNLLVLNLTLV